MATCSYCQREMTSAVSCTVEVLHRRGVPVRQIPHGAEHVPRSWGPRSLDRVAVGLMRSATAPGRRRPRLKCSRRPGHSAGVAARHGARHAGASHDSVT